MVTQRERILNRPLSSSSRNWRLGVSRGKQSASRVIHIRSQPWASKSWIRITRKLITTFATDLDMSLNLRRLNLVQISKFFLFIAFLISYLLSMDIPCGTFPLSRVLCNMPFCIITLMMYTEWPKKMYTLFTHQYLWNKFKWNFYFRMRV